MRINQLPSRVKPMHELSVCQTLISQVEDIARQHRATAVHGIITSLHCGYEMLLASVELVKS